jgi:alpha-tubulin suppressor-like RCC1 family protein
MPVTAQRDIQMSNHIFLYLDNGKIFSWGNNESKIFSEWNKSILSSPILASEDSAWISIDGSRLGFVGLKKNGSIWGIGLNEYGQFGGKISDTLKFWKELSNSKNWTAIGITEKAIYALNQNGELWAMGMSVGDGTSQVRSDWQQLKPNVKWSKIFIDEGTSFFISDNNALFGFGKYRGNEKSSSSLYIDSVKIGRVADLIVDIRSSMTNTGVLWNDGVVTLIGSNAFGQCNRGIFGGIENDILNFKGRSDTGYVKISVDEGAFCGIKRNGEIWGCGQNLCGNLGDGTDSNRCKSVVNKKIKQANQIFTFSPRSSHTGPSNNSCNNFTTYIGYSHTAFVIDKNANLMSFGHNSMNECGDSSIFFNFNFSLLPISKVIKVKSYNGTSFALDDKNQLWFTGEKGNNQSGDLGSVKNPYYLYPSFPYRNYNWSKCIEGDSVLDFDLTTQGIIVLKSDGWIWTWGRNNYGELLRNGTVPMRATSYNYWKKIDFNGHCFDNFLGLLNSDNKIEILGNTPLYPNPKDFILNNRFTDFSVGFNCFYVFKGDSVWTWGKTFSNLGVGNFGNPLTPRILPGKWQSIIPSKIPDSYPQTFGINSKGHLFAWGNSIRGNIGTVDSIDGIIYTPKLVDSSKIWIQVFSNQMTNYGLTQDGEIYYWGRNYLFPTNDQSKINNNIIRPQLLDKSRKWKYISGGSGLFMFGIDDDQNLYGIGAADLGVMGNNSKDHVFEPTVIIKGTNNPMVNLEIPLDVTSCDNMVVNKVDFDGKYKISVSGPCRWDHIDVFDISNKLIGRFNVNTDHEMAFDFGRSYNGLFFVCLINDRDGVRVCKKVIFE